MGKASRDKGKKGEREFWVLCADELGDVFMESRRVWNQNEEERWDMTIGPFGFEVKRIQKGDDRRLPGYWREAVDQVESMDLIPALAYRFDMKDWMVQLRMLDVMLILDRPDWRIYEGPASKIVQHGLPLWNNDIEFTVTMPFPAFAFLCREYMAPVDTESSSTE